jgi:hypothetical protein
MYDCVGPRVVYRMNSRSELDIATVQQAAQDGPPER